MRLRIGYCVLLVAGFLASAAPSAEAASESNLDIAFDGGIFSSGEIGDAEISGLETPVARLRASSTGSHFTARASDFLSWDWYRDTASPSDIGLKLTAVDEIEGQFDPASGSLNFTSSFQLEFIREGEPRKACTTDPFPVTFSTETESRFLGLPSPFADGIEGRGAVWGSWNSLPDTTGDDGWCSDEHFDELVGIGSDGGIMLTRMVDFGVPTPPPSDDPPPRVPTDPTGPGVETRPPPGPRMSIQVRGVRGVGRELRKVAVKIKNDGAAARFVKLCVEAAPTSSVQGRRCRAWNTIEAGTSRRATFRVKGTLDRQGLRLKLHLTMRGATHFTVRKKLRAH